MSKIYIKKKPTNKGTDYIDNKLVTEELIKYSNEFRCCKEKNLPRPKMSDTLGKAILDIANNMIKSHYFSGYTYKDEFAANAIECMLRYAHNYNPKMAGPNAGFSYLSMLCYRKCLKTIAIEKKHNEIKKRAITRAIINDRHRDYSDDCDVVHFIKENDLTAEIEQPKKKKKIKKVKK